MQIVSKKERLFSDILLFKNEKSLKNELLDIAAWNFIFFL